jgi:arginine/lysine/ornithine decarboxylase
MEFMDQLRAPLYEALLQFKAKKPYSFHVPGHKNGMILPYKELEVYQSLLSIDLTELTGLDDLHDPSGIIQDAQQLAAAYYGAKHTYFLVGGSTLGNLTMILSSCNEGDTVLVQRNCHKSVINGLTLAKVKPVFITPQIDKESRVATGITVDMVKAAFAKYPDAKALIITNPNYYGMTMNLTAVIEAAHDYEIPVLVDEAHGAHFGVGEPFPASAVSQGADLVVQSAHKTLPAMTMASYLHFNSKLLNRGRVETFLNVLQSSSPSYPIMASLDAARAYLAKLTNDDLLEIDSDIQSFRSALNQQLSHIKVIEKGKSYTFLDPLKITIQSQCTLTGFEMQRILERQGIYTELADSHNVLMIMPLARFKDGSIIIEKIKHAFEKIPLGMSEQKQGSVPFELEPFTEIEIPHHKMDNYEVTFILLKDAENTISAQDVIPYPPGIPVIINGERINKHHIQLCRELIEAGARFQGDAENGITRIKVVNTPH